MERLNKSIQWLEQMLIIVAFIVMIIVSFAQVVARFVFLSPISWSEEVSRFLFVWIVMLGAGLAVSFNKHFCVDFLVSRFSRAKQKKISWLIAACVIAFAAILVGYGSYVAWFNRFQSSPALLLSMMYPYLCIPLSGFFMLIHVMSGLVAAGQTEHRVGGEGGYIE